MAVRLTREIWQDVLKDITTIIFDCDGVLWFHGHAIPGSPEAVEELIGNEKHCILLTNNSTKSSDMCWQKSQDLGYTCITSANDVISSSGILSSFLQHHNNELGITKAYVIGSAGIADALDSADIPYTGLGPDLLTDDRQIEKIELDPEINAVIFGFDPHLSYLKLARATSYLKRPDCVFIATNDDRTYPCGVDSLLLPGTGSLLASLIYSSERQPIVLGKPNAPTFEYVKDKYNIDPAKTLMVGDRCQTDIAFGKLNGMKTLLVLSGSATLDEVQELEQGEMHEFVPDYYTDTLGDISGFM